MKCQSSRWSTISLKCSDGSISLLLDYYSIVLTVFSSRSAARLGLPSGPWPLSASAFMKSTQFHTQTLSDVPPSSLLDIHRCRPTHFTQSLSFCWFSNVQSSGMRSSWEKHAWHFLIFRLLSVGLILCLSYMYLYVLISTEYMPVSVSVYSIIGKKTQNTN